MSKQPPARLSEADPEFLRLSLCYLEGELGTDGVEKLQAQLRTDPAKRAAFVRLCLTGSALIEAVSEGASTGSGPAGDQTKLDDLPEWPRRVDFNESMILPALNPEPERDETQSALPAATVIVPPARSLRILRSRWLWAASIMIPLLAGLAIYWQIARPRSFATVASSVNAQWSGTTGALQADQRLPATPLVLESGVAEIKFDTGATMVVEAPARFQVRAANAVELTAGQLTAKVPPAAVGFAVETAITRVVDLGTEFGVEVSADGSDAIEVFKGSVRVEPRIGNSSATLVLTEGQAANATGTDLKIDPAGVQPQRFVRNLSDEPTTLDVVDLISGGDGTTRRRGMDIDSMGHVGVFEQVGDVAGDNIYHRITGTPILDGCFIPDGTHGPVQVDSALHTFAFRSTSNRSVQNICTGGRIPSLSGKSAPLLNRYAGPEHSVLYMVTNRGLTLDLAAIRRLHPGIALASFHCLVSSIFPEASKQPRGNLYLIVDGQARFQKTFSSVNGAFPIEAALRPDDRFLTVAITEAGRGLMEGTMLADAVLKTTSRLTP